MIGKSIRKTFSEFDANRLQILINRLDILIDLHEVMRRSLSQETQSFPSPVGLHNEPIGLLDLVVRVELIDGLLEELFY